MASRPSRSDRAPDPARQQLVEVRRGLLRLHKALIDSERDAFERDRGPLSSGQLLQALLEDPFFAWLRPFSGLIVEIDEALAAKEPMPAQQARDYLARIRALVEGGPEAERYERVMSRDPDVLVAHVELTGRLQPG
jgi:hypothetical protein